MSLAICVRCGSTKIRPIQVCKACHFDPQSDEDKAKSLILSLDYEINDEYLGKTRDELLVIGKAIRDGAAHSFDSREIASVVEYARYVQQIPARVLSVGLIKLFGPPAVLLVLLVLLLW